MSSKALWISVSLPLLVASSGAELILFLPPYPSLLIVTFLVSIPFMLTQGIPFPVFFFNLLTGNFIIILSKEENKNKF